MLLSYVLMVRVKTVLHENGGCSHKLTPNFLFYEGARARNIKEKESIGFVERRLGCFY